MNFKKGLEPTGTFKHYVILFVLGGGGGVTKKITKDHMGGGEIHPKVTEDHDRKKGAALKKLAKLKVLKKEINSHRISYQWVVIFFRQILT